VGGGVERMRVERMRAERMRNSAHKTELNAMSDPFGYLTSLFVRILFLTQTCVVIVDQDGEIIVNREKVRI
jgi:hypothetical protein